MTNKFKEEILVRLKAKHERANDNDVVYHDLSNIGTLQKVDYLKKLDDDEEFALNQMKILMDSYPTTQREITGITPTERRAYANKILDFCAKSKITPQEEGIVTNGILQKFLEKRTDLAEILTIEDVEKIVRTLEIEKNIKICFDKPLIQTILNKAKTQDPETSNT
jgi:hypothetical protein